METTSNVGEEPNVKPEETVNTAVEHTQEVNQEEVKTPEMVPQEDLPQGQPAEVTQTETVENLTETLEKPEEVEPEPQPEPLSPDEQILDTWLNNGKTEVSMNELIQAGFDAETLDPHTNNIGRYRLSRLLLVSPFKIERNA